MRDHQLVKKIATTKYFFKMLSYNRFEFILAFYLLFLVIRLSSMASKFKLYNVLTIILAILNFITVILSGREYAHYLITELPYLFIISLFAINFIFEKLNSFRFEPLIAVLLMSIAIVPFYQETKFAIAYVNIENTGSVNFKNSYLKISRYIDKHSRTDDEIYVHSIDANIYLQSRRFANSKLFALPSLDYTKYKGLSSYFENKMEDNPPKYIVMSSYVYNIDHKNNQRMNKFVYCTIKAHYHEIEPFKHNDLMLFKHN